MTSTGGMSDIIQGRTKFHFGHLEERMELCVSTGVCQKRCGREAREEIQKGKDSKCCKLARECRMATGGEDGFETNRPSASTQLTFKF